MNISKTNTFFFKPFNIAIFNNPALPEEVCVNHEGECDFCRRRFRVSFSIETETHVGAFHCESCGNKTPYVGIPGTAAELLADENALLRRQLELSNKHAAANRDCYERAMDDCIKKQARIEELMALLATTQAEPSA